MPNMTNYDYYSRTTDFYTEVCKGNVAGHSIMSAMGEFSSGNIDVKGEDVCQWELVGGPPRLPVPALTGERVSFVSESAADNGTSTTGALIIRMEYLDVTGAQQIEDIVMDGLTVVHSVATDIIFVNDLYVISVGSNGVSEGHITCYKFGGTIALNLYNFIVGGGNKSMVPHRMVPVGYTLVLKGWHSEESQGKQCAFRIRTTSIHGVKTDGVFLFKDITYLNNSASGELRLNVNVPPFAMVKVSGWSSAVATEGSCHWWGTLIED